MTAMSRKNIISKKCSLQAHKQHNIVVLSLVFMNINFKVSRTHFSSEYVTTLSNFDVMSCSVECVLLVSNHIRHM